MFTHLIALLKFYWNAKTINSIHSPFLFKLTCQLLDLKKTPPSGEKIEKLRQRLLNSKKSIRVEDYGAGSHTGKASEMMGVAQIAKVSSSNALKCKLLSNLVRYIQPSCILELGTNLGIATAYLHSAYPSADCVTVEGSESIYRLAKRNLESLGYANIETYNSLFDIFLNDHSSIIHKSDLVYLDGDHRYQSTLDYFDKIWKNWSKSKSVQVIVLDDIYWSKGMTKAWTTIKENYKCQTLDFYKLGIVIRNENLVISEHIKVVPRWVKPLSFGFWG